MKRFLIFITIVIFTIGAFLLWLFGREADSVPILSYHRVNDVDKNALTLGVDQFEQQIKYLTDNGYNFITIDEFLDAREGNAQLPNKPVILTFDAGYVDMFKNVFPILQQYNARATLFAITDYLNLYPTYLTWNQALELQQSGLVDIESNTLSHPDLTDSLSKTELRSQLYGSKQAIEWYLKKPAKYIAYPGGKYTREAEALSRDIGYRAAFTIDYGLARNDPNNYVMSRIPIFGNNSHTLLRFKLHLLAAPILAPIHRFKNQLIYDGNGFIADIIYIP